MRHTIQLGTVQIDDAELADLSRQYHIRELSFSGPPLTTRCARTATFDLLVEPCIMNRAGEGGRIMPD